jgi:hypothetical protein
MTEFCAAARREAESQVWSPEADITFVSLSVRKFLDGMRRDALSKIADPVESTYVAGMAAMPIVELLRKFQAWQDGWLKLSAAEARERSAKKHIPTALTMMVSKEYNFDEWCPVGEDTLEDKLLWCHLQFIEDQLTKQTVRFLLAVREFGCWYLGTRRPWTVDADKNAAFTVVRHAVGVLYNATHVRVIPVETFTEDAAGIFTLPLGIYLYHHSQWPLHFAVYMSDVLPATMPESVLLVARFFRDTDRTNVEGIRKALKSGVIPQTEYDAETRTAPSAKAKAAAETNQPTRQGDLPGTGGPPRVCGSGESGTSTRRRVPEPPSTPPPGMRPSEGGEPDAEAPAAEDVPWWEAAWGRASGRSDDEWRESRRGWWQGYR